MDTTSAPIDPAIRSAIASAAEAGMHEELADELGMTGPELLAFIEGAEPGPQARTRLEVWYRLWADPDKRLSRNAALTILAGYYPEHFRNRARRDFREMLYQLGAS